MNRLTVTQVLSAARLAVDFEGILRTLDTLPAGDSFTASVGPSQTHPLAPRVHDVPVPRAAVVEILKGRRDAALEQLRALGIELLPDPAPAAAAGNRLGEKYDMPVNPGRLVPSDRISGACLGTPNAAQQGAAGNWQSSEHLDRGSWVVRGSGRLGDR